MTALAIILIMFILFSLVIGYLDSILGFSEEEIRSHAKSTPVLMDIQKLLIALNEKIVIACS
jgi:hypothetical protein